MLVGWLHVGYSQSQHGAYSTNADFCLLASVLACMVYQKNFLVDLLSDIPSHNMADSLEALIVLFLEVVHLAWFTKMLASSLLVGSTESYHCGYSRCTGFSLPGSCVARMSNQNFKWYAVHIIYPFRHKYEDVCWTGVNSGLWLICVFCLSDILFRVESFCPELCVLRIP